MMHRTQLDKSIALQQKKFIDAFNGIGDILSHQTKYFARNSETIKALYKIRDIINKFLDIQEKDIVRFEKLCLTQDMWENYDKDRDKAINFLSKRPELYLASFFIALSQHVRVHKLAIETQNDEVARFSAYNLIYILAYTSSRPGRDFLVEQSLRLLKQIRELAIEKHNISMFATSFHWYIDIVYNQLDIDFHLSYLHLFDFELLSSIKHIISNNQKELFQELLAFVKADNFKPNTNTEIYSYISLFSKLNFSKYSQLDKEYNIEHELTKLDDLIVTISTEQDIFKYQSNFRKIRDILNTGFQKELEGNERIQEAIRKLENTIEKSPLPFLRFNNFIEIMFVVGTYCLLKKEYEYIKIMWSYLEEYKPFGTGLFPKTPEEFVVMYFLRLDYGGQSITQKHVLYDFSHSTQSYHQGYFLLLLTKMLVVKNKIYNNIISQGKPDFNFLPFDINVLQYLPVVIKDFLIPHIKRLQKDDKLLTELGLSSADLDLYLLPYLTIELNNSIQSEIEKRNHYLK